MTDVHACSCLTTTPVRPILSQIPSALLALECQIRLTGDRKQEFMMIVVHHLNDSRSQRVLWLLEELNLSYQDQALPGATRTPGWRHPELKEVHPLGKSPVLVDDGQTVFESGAIVDYLIRHHRRWPLATVDGMAGISVLCPVDALRRRFGDVAADAQAVRGSPGRCRCAAGAAHRQRNCQSSGFREPIAAGQGLAGRQ